MRSMRHFLKHSCQGLAERLDRLRMTLDGLRQRVKDAILQAVSETVADVVRQTFDTVLGETSHPLASERLSYDARELRPSSRWTEEDRPPWYDELEDGGLPPDDAPEPTTPPTVASRFNTALSAGCAAALWWLRRQPRRHPKLVALALGLAAALVTYASSPLAVASLGVAVTTSRLTTLAAAMGAGTTLFGGRAWT
jgi:hypothetical protein